MMSSEVERSCETSQSQEKNSAFNSEYLSQVWIFKCCQIWVKGQQGRRRLVKDVGGGRWQYYITKSTWLIPCGIVALSQSSSSGMRPVDPYL